MLRRLRWGSWPVRLWRVQRCGRAGDDGWISLFNGKNLDGWKASENQGTFTVKDGELVVHGDRSHLFYVGPVNNATFKNFEFKAQVKTTQGSNSGIYFHTAYQENDWPGKGFECQVNTTHTRPQEDRRPLRCRRT